MRSETWFTDANRLPPKRLLSLATLRGKLASGEVLQEIPDSRWEELDVFDLPGDVAASLSKDCYEALADPMHAVLEALHDPSIARQGECSSVQFLCDKECTRTLICQSNRPCVSVMASFHRHDPSHRSCWLIGASSLTDGWEVYPVLRAHDTLPPSITPSNTEAVTEHDCTFDFACDLTDEQPIVKIRRDLPLLAAHGEELCSLYEDVTKALVETLNKPPVQGHMLCACRDFVEQMRAERRTQAYALRDGILPRHVTSSCVRSLCRRVQQHLALGGLQRLRHVKGVVPLVEMRHLLRVEEDFEPQRQFLCLGRCFLLDLSPEAVDLVVVPLELLLVLGMPMTSKSALVTRPSLSVMIVQCTPRGSSPFVHMSVR